MPFDPSDLPSSWRRLSGSAAAACVGRLHAEIAPEHALHGVAVRALARCDDDVLYVHAGRFAVVHLTYQGRQEPPLPRTELHDDGAEFLADRGPDAEEENS